MDMMHTPIERVHNAYNLVRSGRVDARFLASMHRLYTRAVSTELLTDADVVLLETVEAEADTNGIGQSTARGGRSVH